jgi:hypothetical protein
VRSALRSLPLVAFFAVAAGCASLPAEPAHPIGVRVALDLPRDAVPVRSRDALPTPELADGEDAIDAMRAARALALAALRDDFAAALTGRGLEVVALEPDIAGAAGRKFDEATLARRAREVDADAALDVELVAYGDIRRSWLWILVAQAVAAGFGHYLAVISATGDEVLAWQVGGAEFLIETATWVGGALVGGRVIDPVLLRVRLVDAGNGAPIHRWTREGLRPWRDWKRWFRRQPLPPRPERLRAVARTLFVRLAPKVARSLEPRAREAQAKAAAGEPPR